MKRTSLSRKILLPTIGLLSASVVGVGFLALSSAERLFDARSRASVRTETVFAAARLGGWIQDRATDVEGWAGLAEVEPAIGGGRPPNR